MPVQSNSKVDWPWRHEATKVLPSLVNSERANALSGTVKSYPFLQGKRIDHVIDTVQRNLLE